MNTLLPKTGGWIFIKEIIPTVTPVHRFALYYAYPTGDYYWKGERALANWSTYADHKHPETDRWLEAIDQVFGDEKNGKKAIANYLKRNNHYDFTSKEKDFLDNMGHEDLEKNYPVEESVKIKTEYGDVVLFDNEYNTVADEKLEEYFEHVKNEHAFIIYLSKSKQLKGKVAEQVFYLRTRGISYTNAIQMCIGEIKTGNLLYLHMHPGYVEHFTREEQFENYIHSHLKAMLSHNLKEEADKYLEQVHSISGYENFQIGKYAIQSETEDSNGGDQGDSQET